MSLVNDALRRARRTQARTLAPATAAAAAPAFRHAAPGQMAPVEARRGTKASLAVFSLALLLLLWHWTHQERQTALPTGAISRTAVSAPATGGLPGPNTPRTGTPRAVTKAGVPPANPNPELAEAPRFSPVPEEMKAGTGPSAQARPKTVMPTSPVSAGEAETGTSPPPAGPANFPPVPLKLQGIILNPKHPAVLINGQMLFVGDQVGKWELTAIHPGSAVLVGAGQTNTLVFLK